LFCCNYFLYLNCLILFHINLFEALIGDRYGGPYLPATIHKNEFNYLKNEMDLNDLKFEFKGLNFQTNDIMDCCYKKDENTKEDDKHVYRLLDIDSISKSDKSVRYFYF